MAKMSDWAKGSNRMLMLLGRNGWAERFANVGVGVCKDPESDGVVSLGKR
jgi:hypothetical protein